MTLRIQLIAAILTGLFFAAPALGQGTTATIEDQIVDMAAIYAFGREESAEVEPHAEVFNLLDSDSDKSVCADAEEQRDLQGLPRTHQQPRYLRFGVAIRF